jgi:hypothetical protein
MNGKAKVSVGSSAARGAGALVEEQLGRGAAEVLFIWRWRTM